MQVVQQAPSMGAGFLPWDGEPEPGGNVDVSPIRKVDPPDKVVKAVNHLKNLILPAKPTFFIFADEQQYGFIYDFQI
jgi:hypothetical protein